MKNPKLNTEKREGFIKNGWSLKVIASLTIFGTAKEKIGSGFMITKWNEKFNAADFATYFSNVWIYSPLNGWFEGFSPFCSTNNGLEAYNKNLKQVHTLRRRLKFAEFFRLAPDIIEHWSKTNEVK